MDSCTGDGCTNPQHKRGMCNAHYQRAWKAGDRAPVAAPTLCSVDGCGQRGKPGSGMCNMHFLRVYRGGEPGEVDPRRLGSERVVDGLRRCAACSQYLPLDAFGVDNTMSDGLKSACRVCLAVAARIWMHNISAADYEARVAAQGGACAVCGVVPDRPLFVDHDHTCCPRKKSCGRCVRGLLCRNCNVAVGLLGDSPERAMSAARYLQGWADMRTVG